MSRLSAVSLILVAALSACARHPETAPAISSTATPAALTDSDRAALEALARTYRDRFPDDSGFWTEAPVTTRLKALLGNKYATFFGCVELKSPVGFKEGILFVTGSNSRDRTYAAVFALEVSTGRLFVKLRERGHDTEYRAAGTGFELPREINTFTRNWSQWPESLALAAGHPTVTDQPVAHAPPSLSNPATQSPAATHAPAHKDLHSLKKTSRSTPQ
jgi:hypothetical protein